MLLCTSREIFTFTCGTRHPQKSVEYLQGEGGEKRDRTSPPQEGHIRTLRTAGLRANTTLLKIPLNEEKTPIQHNVAIIITVILHKETD